MAVAEAGTVLRSSLARMKLPSFFSLIPLYESYLRRCFSASGLTQQEVEIDAETTIHLWGPRFVDRAKASLVLIHGFGPISIWQWRKQVQFFAPQFNVFVPDLIFFGGSTTSSSQRSERFQATSIGKLLVDHFKLEKFHVVGTSYGGFVAYHMAEMLPERVEKVVIASSGVNMTSRDNQQLLERAGRGKVEELLLPNTAEQLRTLMGLAVFRRQLRMVPDFLLNDFIHKLYSHKREEKMELLKGLTIGRDDIPQISSLNQDVLLVWGEHDNLFRLEMATELKRLLGKKVKLEVMKKTSHVPQIEDPTRFNNVVNSFLNR